MAWTEKKKSGGRKGRNSGSPPRSRIARRLLGDRVAAASHKPKKSPAKRKPESDDDEPPRERKPRAGRSGAKRRSKSRGKSRIGRLFYWGAVLGLWAAIAVIGVVIWVGAHLPAIQSLGYPKRPPTIQIVGLDGSVLASRGQMGGEAVALRDLPPMCRTRSSPSKTGASTHFGVDVIGLARRRWTQMRRGVTQAPRPSPSSWPRTCS